MADNPSPEGVLKELAACNPNPPISTVRLFLPASSPLELCSLGITTLSRPGPGRPNRSSRLPSCYDTLGNSVTLSTAAAYLPTAYERQWTRHLLDSAQRRHALNFYPPPPSERGSVWGELVLPATVPASRAVKERRWGAGAVLGGGDYPARRDELSFSLVATLIKLADDARVLDLVAIEPVRFGKGERLRWCIVEIPPLELILYHFTSTWFVCCLLSVYR